MPASPQGFFISLTTVKGVSSTSAEFQHLLNRVSVLAARGIDIDDVQRFSQLREVLRGWRFAQARGVRGGYLSKNLLFSLTPHEACISSWSKQKLTKRQVRMGGILSRGDSISGTAVVVTGVEVVVAVAEREALIPARRP